MTLPEAAMNENREATREYVSVSLEGFDGEAGIDNHPCAKPSAQ